LISEVVVSDKYIDQPGLSDGLQLDLHRPVALLTEPEYVLEGSGRLAEESVGAASLCPPLL
jgi:hypothetical protein